MSLYHFCNSIENLKSLLCKVAFLLFLLLAFYPSNISAASNFWTQSSQLSLGPGISSEVDTCSRGDEVYVVWSDNRTGNREIFFIYSQNAGQTWSREERLTNTVDESTQPAIACDKRNVYLVWREKTEDTSHIYYKRWDGSLWSNDVLLSNDCENSKRPDIASTTLFPNSYLYVVWECNEDDKSASYLIRSTDGGQSFSEPEPVATGDWSTKDPAIWGGARDVYIAWSDNREGNWEIFFRRWGEAQPYPEMRLSISPDCLVPAVGGTEPDIYVAWQCVEKGAVYADIYLSFSMDYGITWTGAQKLTNGEAESAFPKIAMSDEERIPRIFWQDGRNGEWQISLLAINSEYWDLSDEERLSHIEFMTDVGRPSILPDVASTPEQIHLFWSRIEDGSHENIMYMRRDTVAPQRPDTPFHFDLTAIAGYDDDNQITFTWNLSESGGVAKYDIYSAANNDDFSYVGSTEGTSYNVQGESGKSYRIYIEAVDEVGNVSFPSEISLAVICDSTPPEVVMHSPRSNSTMRGAIPIIISINDTNLLEYVVEYGTTAIPSTWQPLAEPFYEAVERKRIITWETSELEGIYTLRILATDEAGNESKVEAIVNIDSQPPVTVLPGEIILLTDPDSEWTYGMPAWSPDGDKIAYHSDAGGTEDIWVMSPIEVGFEPALVRLTRNTAIEHNPAWSPTGDMIAFQSLPAQQNELEPVLWDIWTMNFDGSGLSQLTRDIGSDMNPAWSPDGSSVAFDSDRDGDSEIWLITNVSSVLSGGSPQLIQLTDNDWEDKHPTWSPDGSKVIFQSSRRGNWDLFEIGADGTDLNVILDTEFNEIEPDWSPDRKRILFSTDESGNYYEVRSIDWPEASGQVRLSPKGENALHAHWSPTMDSVVYEHDGSLRAAILVYPAGDLEAVITWPRSGEVFTGRVDVEGTARGDNFQKYSLQYSRYKQPYDFKEIGGESSAPVPETGFLGRWYTEELEGEYLLKLVVTGSDGSSVEDSVQVLIANQLPFILLDEPQNNLVTKNPIVTVSGRTGQRTLVTLNDNEVHVNSDGSFSQDIQLSEGANNITVKAYGSSGQSGEYVVHRSIVLDMKPPEITIDSPVDFQVIHVPYITVEGQVNEAAEISILSKRVWPDGNGRFQRRLSCSEGINLISVMAFDELGHHSSASLRVIFERETEFISDISAPAVTDIFPDNHAVFAGRDLQLSAKIVDDIGLDPLSIVLLFDDEEISNEDYTLDIKIPDAEEDFALDKYPIINITYRPTRPVSEGEHSFKIEVEDTSDNSGAFTSVFSVDTVPSEALISAVLADENWIRIVAVSNKPLARISGGAVHDMMTQRGYSLSSFTQKDGYYEANLEMSPSQRNFLIDFEAVTYLGDEVNAYGYMAWDEVWPAESVEVGVAGQPQFLSEPIEDITDRLTFVLRSQDGLDTDLLALQQSDAEYRRLHAAGLVYVLSVSEELKEDINGILSLSVLDRDRSLSSVDAQRLVMFHWDEDLRVWEPVDKMGSSDDSLFSSVSEPGIYTLFEDIDAPVISDVSPLDAGEVPLDRFFVEATILDSGAGISQIKFIVDEKEVDYEYDAEEGLLTYFPSMLEWGLHKMEIIAIDRAGNIAEFSSSFLTKEAFQFIIVRAYPNPANNEAKIEFKLTRLANVTLKIYTITGEPVYDSEKNETAEGIFVWKCENNAGSMVASGVYIYSIDAVLYDSQIHEQGTIAVVR